MHQQSLENVVLNFTFTDWYIVTVTQLPNAVLWVFSLEYHLYRKMLIYEEAHMAYADTAKAVEAQVHKHH